MYCGNARLALHPCRHTGNALLRSARYPVSSQKGIVASQHLNHVRVIWVPALPAGTTQVVALLRAVLSLEK